MMPLRMRKTNKKDDIINKLRKCACRLDRWCTSHKMVLSIEKTKKIFISNSQTNSKQRANNHLANVKISNTTIDEVDSTKLLGVIVDKILS